MDDERAGRNGLWQVDPKIDVIEAVITQAHGLGAEIVLVAREGVWTGIPSEGLVARARELREGTIDLSGMRPANGVVLLTNAKFVPYGAPASVFNYQFVTLFTGAIIGVSIGHITIIAGQ